MLRVSKLIMSSKCIHNKDNVLVLALLNHKKVRERKQNASLVFGVYEKGDRRIFSRE